MFSLLEELTGTDHHMVVTKVRERFAISKQVAQKQEAK
jgi:hypothetical protein